MGARSKGVQRCCLLAHVSICVSSYSFIHRDIVTALVGLVFHTHSLFPSHVKPVIGYLLLCHEFLVLRFLNWCPRFLKGIPDWYKLAETSFCTCVVWMHGHTSTFVCPLLCRPLPNDLQRRFIRWILLGPPIDLPTDLCAYFCGLSSRSSSDCLPSVR